MHEHQSEEARCSIATQEGALGLTVSGPLEKGAAFSAVMKPAQE
jgi:hypothetical protein